MVMNMEGLIWVGIGIFCGVIVLGAVGSACIGAGLGYAFSSNTSIHAELIGASLGCGIYIG